MDQDLEKAARVIREASSLVTTGHVNPDGDALGAALGLALMTRAEGGVAHTCFGGNFVLPDHFAFLDTGPLADPSQLEAPMSWWLSM